MSRIAAYAIAMAAVLGLAGWGAWSLYHAGAESVQAKWDAATARAEVEYQRLARESAEERVKLRQSLADGEKNLVALQGQLAEASKKGTLTRIVTVAAPPEAPRECPPCSCPVLDTDFIRLWNAAGTPPSPTPAR